MAIRNECILEWIDVISRIHGLQMDPVSLTDDVVLMAMVFRDEEAFVLAMNNVARALTQLINGLVETSQLEHHYSGWEFYHFQSHRTQGHRADLRIVFLKVNTNVIRVKGFGHRHLPLDIYNRLRPR